MFHKRIVFGSLCFYVSSEIYLHFKTHQIIKSRHELVSASADGIDKFKSATVFGMFVNPFQEYRPQTGFEFMLVRIIELFESFYGNQIELHEHPPKDQIHTIEDYLKVYKPNIEVMRNNSKILRNCIEQGQFKPLHGKGWFRQQIPLNKQLIVTWLGQSCSLIQLSGINFLTDPILSNHLFSHNLGPKRLNESPMNLHDIKYATNESLNFVLVSHDHPDHLELDLVKQIGNKSTWIVPLGLKLSLARRGVYNVIEMDWWDSVNLNQYIDKNLPDEYEVVCVPSMHWSGRYIVDANFSLWCSFIIKQNGKSIVYHGGDTGYCPELFGLIGRKFGPINLSLLPIGQYCPSWHQKPRHISPQEAIAMTKSLQSRFMYGVHWGTFKLSSEPILEPKLLLNKLACKIGKQSNYKAPEFGLTYLIDIDNNIEYEIH